MIKLFCFTSILLMTCFLSAQDKHDKTEYKSISLNYKDEVRKTIISKAKEFPDNTQLSIAITKNGKTEYYGIIKQNDSIKFIENQNKIFEIGSITKVLTATLLTSLVEEGQINLTDNINRYYPFPFKNNTKLTFQSLANHSSGLPRLPSNLVFLDPDNPYRHYNKSYLDKYLKDLIEIKSDSKNNYTYSNLGFAILGYTLGLSQNKEFEQLLQERVLDKYGMKQSYTEISHISNNLVAGLNANGDTTPNWQFNIFFGAGGVLSTTEDLSKFAKAQFNSQHSELALTQKPTFTVNETLKLGLGWHILKTQNGKELLTHNGGTGGYSSSMLVNVADQTAVIILSNVSAFHPKTGNIEQISLQIMSIL